MTQVEMLLYEYNHVKKRISELEMQIEELTVKKEAIYDKLLEPRTIKDRVTGGPFIDPVVDAVVKLVDVYAERIRRVTGDLAAANRKLAQIEALVDQADLSETERRYVQLRYFKRMPAWKVAQEIGYVESTARGYKQNALNKMLYIMPETNVCL